MSPATTLELMAAVNAAIPDDVATAESAPSRAATACSSARTVGLPKRE